MPSHVEERDANICRRYVAEGISAARLGLDVGLSEVRVRQILKTAGVTVKNKSPTLAEGDDGTLSRQHARLGKKLLTYRSLTLGVDRPYLAEKMNWTNQKIASVEKGIFNLTLLDLQDLARLFETTLSTLLANTEDADSLDEIPTQDNLPDKENE